MINLVIQTYILVKIPFIRAYLKNLIGKDLLERYLSKYTGSDAVLKITKYLGSAVNLIASEVIIANRQSEAFLKAAKSTEKNFHRDCENTNHILSYQEYKEMIKVRDGYIDKAAHSTGVITRGFTAGVDSFSSSDSKK